MSESALYGRFFQIGYVTRDIDLALAHLTRRMGARQLDVLRDFRPGGNRVEILHLAHMSLPGVEIEVIQPRLDWPSIYLGALPDGNGEVGFHHLGFMLPDLAAWDRAMSSLEAMQTPVVMQGTSPAVRFAYIDTRRRAGHYSELVYRATTPGIEPSLMAR